MKGRRGKKDICRLIIIQAVFVVILMFLSPGEAEAAAEGGTGYGYSRLTSVQQVIYNRLKEVAEAFVSGSDYREKTYTDVIIGEAGYEGLCSKEDFITAYLTFDYDNPQYYWISKYYSYSIRSDGMGGRISLKLDNTYLTPESRLKTDEAIKKISGEWYDILTAIDGNYERVLALHDLIINAIDYRRVNGEPADEKWAHSIAGVFLKQGAVCEGYAKTFQYMLNMLGIDNIYIIGDANGEGHAWNAVKLGGEYYLTDVTWDDMNGKKENSGFGLYYDYFLMPESIFNRNHTAYKKTGGSDRWLYDLPAFSDNDKYIYYNRYKSNMPASLATDGLDKFIRSAKAAERNGYVYFITANTDDLLRLLKALGITGNITYTKGIMGCLYVYEVPEAERNPVQISSDNALRDGYEKSIKEFDNLLLLYKWLIKVIM